MESHRRVRKQLPIPDGDADNERIWCNWDDCPDPASLLHKVRVCHAAAPFRHSPKSAACGMCEVKCFCSAQHLDYWQHSHVPGTYGKLSSGINPRYI